MDELLALVEANNPDLNCITEIWLYADTANTEIAISGYISCRRDRDRHGGGVMLYIRDTFQFTQLPNPPEGLELLPIILQHNVIPVRFCISIFYRPPSSSPDLLDDICTYFDSIDSAHFTNLVIVGDFNVDMSTYSHPLFQKVNNIMDTYCLSQMVTQFTHVHHNGTKSIIDLLFVSDPQLVRSCFTIPPLSNSDHCGLNIELNLKTIPKASKRRTVWRYCHADWEKAHRLIEGTNWDSLLDPEDINTSWKNWSAKFLEIMQSSIPTTTLPPRRNRPWLTKKLVQAIRRRNALFKEAKATNDFTKYRQYRNKIVNYLRSAKQAYFGKLNPRKPKEFWKACKLLNKTFSSIPVLTNNNSTAYTNVDKAELLNSFFVSCFNKLHMPLGESDYKSITCTENIPEELLCDEDFVLKLLASLDSNKATGPDKISAIMLKKTATSIAPSVTSLFNQSLKDGHVPLEWKLSHVVPIPK